MGRLLPPGHNSVTTALPHGGWDILYSSLCWCLSPARFDRCVRPQARCPTCSGAPSPWRSCGSSGPVSPLCQPPRTSAARLPTGGAPAPCIPLMVYRQDQQRNKLKPTAVPVPKAGSEAARRVARRLVRQDTPLWCALHRGCLTGGHLNAALGFYEPACAKKLGMPASFVGHQRLLAAYSNLLLRPHEALSDALAEPATQPGGADEDGSRRPAPAVAGRRKNAAKVLQARLAVVGSGAGEQRIV